MMHVYKEYSKGKKADKGSSFLYIKRGKLCNSFVTKGVFSISTTFISTKKKTLDYKT